MMYPTFGPGNTPPSTTPMPPSRSTLGAQPPSQGSNLTGGQSSLPPYPSAPPPPSAPSLTTPYPNFPFPSTASSQRPQYPMNAQGSNANSFTPYSLPTVGYQPGAYQGGSSSHITPYPPAYPGYQQPPPQSSSMNMMSNQNPHQAPIPNPSMQGGYPNYNPYQPTFSNPYPSPYPQQPRGMNAPYDPVQAFAGGYNVNAHNNRLREVAQKYEINDALAQRLNILQQYEIVVLCDDSGSMNTPVSGTNGTRWDELRTIVQIVVEIGTIFDSNGVDVHFLNRPPNLNVTDPRQIMESFSKPPGGLTPLTPALRRIFQEGASKSNSGKSLLVFIATDGAPTDNHGNTDIRGLENLMRNERQANRVYVTFLACTDDDSAVSYLSEWDRTMVNVDVVDDYKTEREEVRRAQGPNYPFSFGDYVVKALIGAVDAQMDSLDDYRR